jgi:hypothetical protein
MEVTHTLLQTVCQALVVQVVQVRLQILQLDVSEHVSLVIRGAVSQQVVDCHATLTAGGHKDNHRLGRRVFADGEVGWLGHGDHQ